MPLFGKGEGAHPAQFVVGRIAHMIEQAIYQRGTVPSLDQVRSHLAEPGTACRAERRMTRLKGLLRIGLNVLIDLLESAAIVVTQDQANLNRDARVAQDIR